MKVYYYLLITLFLIHCKKETDAYVSNDEDSNDKVENSEAKGGGVVEGFKVDSQGIATLEDNDSITDSPTAFSIDKEGKLQYKYKLQKGKKYPFNITTTETKESKAQGKSLKQNASTTDNISFKVLDVQNGFYKIAITFEDSKNSVTADGATYTIDAKGAKPANEMLQLDWAIKNAIIGNVITMQMDEFGNMSNFSGFDVLINKVISSIKDKLPSDQITPFKKSLQDQFNPEVFQKQFDESSVRFPKKGVKIGETWKEKKGSRSEVTYKLLKVENKKAYISISSGLPAKTESKKEGKLSLSETRKGKQTGTLIIDVESGWIVTGDINQNQEATLKISDGTNSESQSIISKQTIKINH